MFNKLIEYVSVPEADPEKIKILDKVTEQISALPSETKGIDVADFVQMIFRFLKLKIILKQCMKQVLCLPETVKCLMP